MLCAATLACTSAVCPRRSSRALPTLITSPTAKTPSRPSTCHMGPCHPQHYKCSRHVCKQGSGRETDLQAGINTNGAVGRKHESIAARQTRPTRPFRARLFSDLMPKSVRARRPAHTREDKVGVYSAAHEIWQPTHGKAPAVCFKSVSPSCHSDIAMLPRCAHCRCTNGHVVGSPFPAFGHVRGVAYGGGEVHVQHSTTSNILQPMCAEHLSSVHADALSGAAAPSCEACVAKCLSARADPTCPWYRTLQRTQKGRERENRSPSGCSAPRTRTEDGEEEPSGAGASTPAASESWMISQRCPRSTSTLCCTAKAPHQARPALDNLSHSKATGNRARGETLRSQASVWAATGSAKLGKSLCTPSHHAHQLIVSPLLYNPKLFSRSVIGRPPRFRTLSSLSLPVPSPSPSLSLP